MKKVILVLAITSLFVNCKKKETKPEEPVKEQTYCIYWYNGGVKTFYKCVEGKEAANSEYTTIVNGGNEAEAVAKSSCSECQ